jgi:hypothetical protein
VRGCAGGSGALGRKRGGKQRDMAIATANSLLGLVAALGEDTPVGGGATVPGTFAIKHRWADGACSPWLVLRRPLTFRRHDLQEPGLEPEG